MKRALAVVLALALAVSPVGGFALAGASAAAPAGMSTIPSDNARISDTTIERGQPKVSALPSQAQGNRGPPPQALKHIPQQALDNIQASSHASTLVVDIAPTDSGGVGLVLTDEQHSDGRRVAVPVSVFDGDVPELARGVHESGERWQAPITVEGDYAEFRVPHFSSNTVTFSGSVEITATPASDGAQFSYDINDLDAASNPNITLTGSTSTEWDNQSWTSVSDGDILSLNIAGNLDPTGPANGEPKLSITASGSVDNSGQDAGGLTTGDVDADGIAEIIYQDASGSLNVYDVVDGTNTDTGQATSSKLTAGDIDNDGEDEIGYLNSSNYLFVHDVSDGSDTLTGDRRVTNHPRAGDPDNDGRDEIGFRRDATYDVEWYNHDGSFGSTNRGTFDQFSFGDIDGDGIDDVAQRPGNLVIIDDIDGTEYDTGLKTAGTATGNLDGDGAEEIAYRRKDDTLGYYDNQTNQHYQTGIAIAQRPPSVGDIDNDGVGEIIARDSNNEIIFYDVGDGSATETGVSMGTSGRPKPADVDDDGDVETNYHDENSNLKYFFGGSVAIDADLNNDGTTEATLSAGPGNSKSSALGLSLSDSDIAITGSTSFLDSLSIQFQERTETVDPNVETNGNWLNHSGTLTDGSTTTLTGNSTWLSDLSTNRVNVSVGDGTLSADAPNPQVDLNYSHDAEDNQAIDYTDQQWTSGYNQSKTWASDRASADLSIPFENNVVAVRNLQHRINGSSWSTTSSANYDLSGNDLTVDLDAIYGGTIPATTSMAVKVTGSKVKTSDLDLTVLNATAAGADLDSKIQVSNLGTDPTINVGPTDEGERVHYLYSESWSDASESVVIESNGDQHLEMPNAVEDGTARVTHLQTKVSANTGDVRIEVLEAGETPELDVSPGPGGEGDDVTIKYFNTESGVEYLLESLTRAIVLDSDTAESPAIFEDDDSDETWSIFEDDTITSSTNDDDDTGGVGQVARDAGNGILDNLPLLAGLGGGLLVTGVVVSRLFGSSDSVAQATGTIASSTGSLTARLGSGIQSVVGGLLSWAGGLLAQILANRRAAIALGVVGLVAANALDLIGLPSGTATLLVVAGVPLVSYIALTSIGRYSQTIWVGTTAVATVLGLELIAPGTVSTAITQLTSETVAPLLILLVGGVAFYWFRIRGEDASTPDEVNEITIESSGGDSD